MPIGFASLVTHRSRLGLRRTGNWERGTGHYELVAGWKCWSLEGRPGGSELGSDSNYIVLPRPQHPDAGNSNLTPISWLVAAGGSSGSSEHQHAAVGEQHAAASSKQPSFRFPVPGSRFPVPQCLLSARFIRTTSCPPMFCDECHKTRPFGVTPSGRFRLDR